MDLFAVFMKKLVGYGGCGTVRYRSNCLRVCEFIVNRYVVAFEHVACVDVGLFELPATHTASERFAHVLQKMQLQTFFAVESPGADVAVEALGI